ncbi:MAG: AAA family ATPase [Planctomycetales bacterium]|nr:AAA family ATPase [Planctomycetales bacterium]
MNLEALTELTDLEQRHAFLTSQQEDLTAARGQLQEIIKRINRRSREMFEQTFAQVKQNFQTIFRQLFGGGKADIVLEDETDVLQSGIEIIAKPPGKEPASISLLSGGEKVMTCIAVLFAVFRSKPSPFCILDEVDAALDETNIDRFIAMLKEFTKDSQFVIITHNKRTMAAAEAIYGVTMPEPGVSRPISMRLEEAEKHAEDAGGGGAPATEEPTPAGATA